MAGVKLYPSYIALVQTHENPEILKISYSVPKIDTLTGEVIQPTKATIIRDLETIRPGQNAKHIELFKSKWVKIDLA